MQFVQNNWALILVLLVSGAMLVWPWIQRRISPMQEVGPAQATQLINRRDAVMLDLREPAEYQGGRAPRAVHIPQSQLASRGQELAKLTSRPVIAYCERGNRSRMAGSVLAKLGFTEVYSLHGGLRAWKDAGLPVEND